MNSKAQRDNEIMDLLGITELRHIVAHTNLGDLAIILRKGGTGQDYRFVLDAVEMDEEKSKQLMDLYKFVVFGKGMW